MSKLFSTSMNQTKTPNFGSPSPFLIFISSLLIAGSLASFAHQTMGYGGVKPREGSGGNTDDCQTLPHSDFLTAQQLDFICDHRKMWLHERDSRVSTKDFFSKPTDKQKAYLESLERCSPETDGCEAGPSNDFVGYLGGKNETRRRHRRKVPYNLNKKVIRKEYRMMSSEERENLNRAMNGLKSKIIDNVSIWDLHTLIHYPDSAPGAHWGPAFLPWHREFLRQFEVALQNEVRGVSLPYWDSTLDQGLPDPSDSVMWSDELMGNGNGYVKTGPFQDWNTNVFMPLSPVPVKKLYRSTGGRPNDRLLSPKDVEWITTRERFRDLTFCHDKTFESMHGLSHVWVGGFMYVIRVSPNDPTFYMHHAFIDNLWEQFRQTQQSRRRREYDYARKICNRQHSYYSQMKPLNIRNKDGLSNDYTDFWYEYQVVRHCTAGNPTCDSPYYFCDMNAWKCRSKIQLGGNCTGFSGTEICYSSLCIQNVCRIPATEGNGYARKESPSVGVVWTKTLMLGDDDQPLTSGIAHIIVRDGLGYESVAYIQRTTYYPELPSLVYLPLPNPHVGITYNITLEARDHYGRYCQSYCFNSTIYKYQVCEPRIGLNSEPVSASNISYTHSYAARRFLDMDMSVHPSEWKVYAPFIVFACHRKPIQSFNVLDIAEKLVPPRTLAEYVWFRVNILRKPNSNTSIEDGEIEVEDLDDPTDLWISSIRRARSAYDQSVVFVRAKNPYIFTNGITVRISIVSGDRTVSCDARCNMGDGFETLCEPVLFLHENAEKSQEKIFAADPGYLQLLGWKMIGHSSEWHFKMAFLSFYC